jgi:hypothetical protein
MILLRSADIVKIDGQRAEVVEMDNSQLYYKIMSENETFDVNPVEFKKEVVEGRSFIRFKDGVKEEIVIGATKEIQDMIGIHYDAFDEMSRMLDMYKQENVQYQIVIKQFREMKFWQRLKFLFKAED